MDKNLTNRILADLADLLHANRAEIISANQRDVASCPETDAVIVDRLKVDDKKIDTMIASVRQVASAASPIEAVLSSHIREDGLRIENRAVPFGTILIIYEARPDVTIEAASIALKAGNRILLKGGKEARQTNLCLSELWQKALEANEADEDFVRYLDISREETQQLISGQREKFDLVIPRGGDELISFVLKNSHAPVIVSGRGNNFAYLSDNCDFEKALNIILNGKQRLSVCNALDKVLISSKLPQLESRIEEIAAAFHSKGIEVLGDKSSIGAVAGIEPVESEEVWYEEFLSAKIALRVVSGLNEAVEVINKYSGGHSAVIVTENEAEAADFMSRADCAAVYHNASTRFTDGGEFGLGAEIAISTQKLHFRGPLGAEHLVTNKWFVFGSGQVRK